MKSPPLRQILRGANLIQPKLTKVVKRHESYTCGIPPLPPRLRQPPPPPPAFPVALVRPPCYPGQSAARTAPCNASTGLYCPTGRDKFEYPSFSENIDFVPSGSRTCWWNVQPQCELNADDDEQLPFKP